MGGPTAKICIELYPPRYRSYQKLGPKMAYIISCEITISWRLGYITANVREVYDMKIETVTLAFLALLV